MIHLFLLQYCARCCDKSACCYDTLIDFLKECLIFFGKSLGVSISILLFLFIIIISSLFLIWVIKIAKIWMKQELNPVLKDKSKVQSSEKPSEICRLVKNSNCMRAPNIQCEVIVIVNSLLSRMYSAIDNYCKDDTDDAQKNREMITFQECLFHLQNCKLNIESIRNIKIDEYLESLSECLNDMAERKYGNDPEKVDEAMKERERIAENFKQAKEGIEKSYK